MSRKILRLCMLGAVLGATASLSRPLNAQDPTTSTVESQLQNLAAIYGDAAVKSCSQIGAPDSPEYKTCMEGALNPWVSQVLYQICADVAAASVTPVAETEEAPPTPVPPTPTSKPATPLPTPTSTYLKTSTIIQPTATSAPIVQSGSTVNYAITTATATPSGAIIYRISTPTPVPTWTAVSVTANSTTSVKTMTVDQAQEDW